jgi:hypothetical protein
MILLDAGIQPSEIPNMTLEEAIDLANLRVMRSQLGKDQVLVPTPKKWGVEAKSDTSLGGNLPELIAF